jgi:cytosine/adenosine deaminase-related metal-dependent hydrolase
VPLNDATNQIVHVEDGTGVHSVMIGGRMVVDAGRVTTVDVSRLSRLAETAMERLRGLNENARRMAKALEPVVNGFCHTLATAPYPVDRYGSRHA